MDIERIAEHLEFFDELNAQAAKCTMGKIRLNAFLRENASIHAEVLRVAATALTKLANGDASPRSTANDALIFMARFLEGDHGD